MYKGEQNFNSNNTKNVFRLLWSNIWFIDYDLLNPNAILMILGCVIGYFIFFMTDKIFKNNGIYLGWSIIMTAIIFYWIQKKVDKSNNSID